MATWLQQFGDWNTNMNAGIFGGKNAAGVMQQASGFGKTMGSLGINAGNIGGIANTIGQLGTGLLAGQNHSDVGDTLQTIGGLASNIPGVGGLIGAGVGVVGGLVNAAFGSNINEEFVSQTKSQANALGSRVFNANTNADLLNDWQSMVTQSNVSKSEVGSDGWFSNKASRETRRLNERINEANRRQLANFDIAAQNVDDMNDLRILQNMAAYGGPINSFRKYYADGGLFNTPQFFTFEPQTYDKGGYLNQAKALIRQNEGWSAKPYSDSPKGRNWRSVGYGFNDSGFRDKYPEGISKHYEHGITKKQAEEELDYFLNKAEKRLKSIYGKQWNDFSDSQKAAILDTYYQRPASVDKSSRFYKAVTAGEDAGKYLGVAGFNKRNSIRQNVFSGRKSTGQEYSMNDDSENTLTYPSPILEATSPIVDYSEAFAGVTPTQAKALELNFAAPNMDFLASLGQPTRQAQTTPTVGTVEDFLSSYGNFDDNFFAKGGYLTKSTLANSKKQLNIFQQSGDIFKANNSKDMNIFDFGGGITHGVNWDTGVDYVAEGQSHEQNPYGGVMVGQDEEGTPNLVEEGEYIWNSDYVFSRRMKVPKKLREKYKLPEDATFADAVKVLTKESEERPNDEISRATQDHILGELADSQEELRAAKAQRAMDKQMQLQDDFLMGMQFGLGGGLFADGGGIHIDPSKKGTFKAQASKMGMGVQEAASHILANKENYSPAMVKKAVFAHNFAHALGGSLFANGGDLFSKPSFYNEFKKGGHLELMDDTTPVDRRSAEDELVYDPRTRKYILKSALSTSNRETGNKKQAAVSDTQGTKKGSEKKGSARTKQTKGATGLNLYGYYTNGNDDISTPTGFKVDRNGKAFDYTPEYRELVSKLGANDIRAWAAAHPNDSSLKSFLAKGNKLENLTDEQWRTGATDGKYGFMHHVADQIGKETATVPADYNWEQEAPWLFGNVAAPTPQLRPMEQIARDKSTPTRSVSVTDNGTNFGVTHTPQAVTRSGITDTTSGAVDGITRSPFKPKQTWTRYAPLAMNALFGLKEMLTPADYTNANAIMDAAYQVGTPVSIGTEYIGDYRKRDPFDESYLMNIINQNSRAANRNFMNTSGGNRAVAMSGILANDLITQRSLAEAARQAYLANRADDAQVAEFNRGTNIFNAQAQNQRNQYLAGLNSQRQNAMLSGISQGARLRQAIKDQRDAAISANLSAFAQGLGDLGRENGFYNMLGGLNDERILKYFYGDDWNTKFNG